MRKLDAYAGKSVLVTGSAGFKGRWLCRVLRELGADVAGFDIIESIGDDVRCLRRIDRAIRAAQPDFVFHLAAQAFVPVGFTHPVATFETNAMGTVNLLEALRGLQKPCAVVIVTSDKVFGSGGPEAYIEDDYLFGNCPYSASKVAAETAVAAYRKGYFAPEHRVAVATARAGNVIGGGDAGAGRLIPNAIRALQAGKPIPVYNPVAVRPWQYIEDVIHGYLLLGAALASAPTPVERAHYAGAWNFGPEQSHTTLQVVEAVIREWGSGSWEQVKTDLRETNILRIDSTKARLMLGWKQHWSFEDAIRETVRQYKG